MKIEINVVPGRGKNISVYEFDNDGKPKLITKGNSPQHYAFVQNVLQTLNDRSKWSVSNVGNKVFAVSI